MSKEPWKPFKQGDRGNHVAHGQWLLAGKNRHNINAKPGMIDGDAGDRTMDAVQRMKYLLGLPKRRCTREFGNTLRGYLVPRVVYDDNNEKVRNNLYVKRSPLMVLRSNNRKGKPTPYDEKLGTVLPTGAHWVFPDDAKWMLNGRPFQGTHRLGNWQSDHAVDLNVAVGTPLLALYDGIIGDKMGPLDSDNPRMSGLRFYLNTPDNSFYYAHASRIIVEPGERVRRGQILGYSGSAAGVPHLHLGQMNGLPTHTLAID